MPVRVEVTRLSETRRKKIFIGKWLFRGEGEADGGAEGPAAPAPGCLGDPDCLGGPDCVSADIVGPDGAVLAACDGPPATPGKPVSSRCRSPATFSESAGSIRRGGTTVVCFLCSCASVAIHAGGL